MEWSDPVYVTTLYMERRISTLIPCCFFFKHENSLEIWTIESALKNNISEIFRSAKSQTNVILFVTYAQLLRIVNLSEMQKIIFNTQNTSDVVKHLHGLMIMSFFYEIVKIWLPIPIFDVFSIILKSAFQLSKAIFGEYFFCGSKMQDFFVNFAMPLISANRESFSSMYLLTFQRDLWQLA